ncbi:MAG: F0F1 ATP synthase subunit epsilon [Micrococcales bacterium]|nr:F0F1 ATP synthase subunit epsilon [Micrococcales bacterium]
MASDLTLAVQIVDYSGTVWRGDGKFVLVPTAGGPLGIYPQHQPLLAILADGEVKVEKAGGGEIHAQVIGGFVSVDSDQVTIATDEGSLAA